MKNGREATDNVLEAIMTMMHTGGELAGVLGWNDIFGYDSQIPVLPRYTSSRLVDTAPKAQVLGNRCSFEMFTLF
jgi:hypothetical protein